MFEFPAFWVGIVYGAIVVLFCHAVADDIGGDE